MKFQFECYPFPDFTFPSHFHDNLMGMYIPYYFWKLITIQLWLFRHISVTMVWTLVLKNNVVFTTPFNCHENVMEMWWKTLQRQQGLTWPITFPSLFITIGWNNKCWEIDLRYHFSKIVAGISSSHSHENVMSFILYSFFGPPCKNQNNGTNHNNGPSKMAH